MNNIINDLYELITERKNAKDSDDKSYTCYLFREGLNKILKKIGEETTETIVAAKDLKYNNCGDADKQAVVGEVSDLIYHLLVMLADLDISFEEIERELKTRSEKMGNLKSKKTVDKNT